MRWSKLAWLIRQVVPLTYRSHYGTEDGVRHFAVWKMWLGRCYAVEDHVLA